MWEVSVSHIDVLTINISTRLNSNTIGNLLLGMTSTSTSLNSVSPNVFDSSIVMFHKGVWLLECDIRLWCFCLACEVQHIQCRVYVFVLLRLSMAMLPHTTEAICTNALLCHPLHKKVCDVGLFGWLNRCFKSWITLKFSIFFLWWAFCLLWAVYIYLLDIGIIV